MHPAAWCWLAYLTPEMRELLELAVCCQLALSWGSTKTYRVICVLNQGTAVHLQTGKRHGQQDFSLATEEESRVGDTVYLGGSPFAALFKLMRTFFR